MVKSRHHLENHPATNLTYDIHCTLLLEVTIIIRNGTERNGIFREEFKPLFYGTEH